MSEEMHDSELRADLAEIRSDVRSLTGTLNKFIESSDARFGRVENRLTDMQRGDPKMWLSAFSVLITIIGMAAVLVMFSIRNAAEPLHKDVFYGSQAFAQLREEFKDHENNHGHPVIMQEVAEIKARIQSVEQAMAQKDQRIERVEGFTNGKYAEALTRIAVLEAKMETLFDAKDESP